MPFEKNTRWKNQVLEDLENMNEKLKRNCEGKRKTDRERERENNSG